MSSSAVTPPPPVSFPRYLASIGLGYSIAIAFGFLVLLSTIFLSSYLCFRRRYRSSVAVAVSGDVGVGIILPRVIFVAEEDDDDDLEANAVGLDQSVINSYPKFEFSKESEGVGDGTCSICLCEYKESEMLRMMPECKHSFHLCCLDAWLKLNGSCPVCRNSPLPTPLSTPLSEVVPLSQYAADRTRTRR